VALTMQQILNSSTALALLAKIMASAPRPCDALIDQERVIGGDPVGHACHNVATARYRARGLRWRTCYRCKAWLEEGNGRVTLPAWRGEIDSLTQENV
jgi:hypothetical protein